MNIRKELNSEFSMQHLNTVVSDDAELERYVRMAEGYAEIESALVVLSDLHTNKSYVVHGKFSDILDVDKEKCSGYISSIWEDDIFKAINSDDLEMKMSQ